MDGNIGISKYQTKQMLLKLLLCTVYISFICLIRGQVQAIADFNYTLHEIMYLPVNIAIFIVPIEFIAFIYYWIRWRSEMQNFIKQNYPDENENYSIEALLHNAIYKIQKTLLTFNCD